MDYSLLIGLVGGVIAFIGAIFVTRYIVSELKRSQDSIFKRLEKHGDDIVALNTKSKLAVTAKDVDDKFVSKELFRQFERHMDKRFDLLEQGQGKILNFMENHT